MRARFLSYVPELFVPLTGAAAGGRHALAEALTGGEVLCNGCECFNKPPGLSRHTPPHQGVPDSPLRSAAENNSS